jgi:general secretion pathway protein A
MYCRFYRLKERPFNVTSDPSFFFLSNNHREAISHVLYGVTQRKGIIVVTGEIGTGKTTLCRFFLEHVRKNTKTAFILNPYVSEVELLEIILRDFGVRIRNRGHTSLMWEFNRFLIKEARKNHNVVLLIDEAQNLKMSQLEQIRLLSNLETEKDKLLQIILIGQPELNKTLAMQELRQLQQRVMVRCHIRPLDYLEVRAYIEHRLRVSGGSHTVNFSDEAFEEIADFSNGIPRLINIICDRALLAGFVQESYRINGEIIRRCMDEISSYYEGAQR